jgi:hypothetical protein
MSDGQVFQWLASQTTARLCGVGEADQAELLGRCILLGDEQRRLMELVLSGRHSLRELGRLIGLNPGSLCRRVRAIKQRLRSPVAAALAERGRELSDRYLRIAVAHFLHGDSVRHICRDADMPRAEALAILQYIRGWAAMPRRRVG